LFSPEFASRFSNAVATYKSELGGNRLSFIAFKQVPWHHYSRLSVEQSQIAVRSPYLDNELVQLAYRAPDDIAINTTLALRLIADGNPALARIPTDRGLVNSPRPIITHATKAWSEATVRAEYMFDYGMPQWLARLDKAFTPVRLDRLFLGRHKFYHFRTWYRRQLAPFVRDVLLDPKSLSRPYLRRSAVETLVRDHTSGRRNHTLQIHQLLTAELIHRQLLHN
jgi:asparagine synthase (glutamine-hydrolysing)